MLLGNIDKLTCMGWVEAANHYTIDINSLYLFDNYSTWHDFIWLCLNLGCSLKWPVHDGMDDPLNLVLPQVQSDKPTCLIYIYIILIYIYIYFILYYIILYYTILHYIILYYIKYDISCLHIHINMYIYIYQQLGLKGDANFPVPARLCPA